MNKPFRRTALASALVAGLAACGQGGADHDAPHGNNAADHSRSDMRMHEAMTSVVGADVSDTFARKMIAHHEGAIEMTDAIVAEGGDPQVVAIARRMGDQQRREMEEMRALVRKGAPPDPASARPYAAGEKRMHDAMTAVHGGDASETFLRRMIAHHQGAVAMSEVVLAQGGDERVAAIARRIVADQTREIAEMKALLSGRPPA